MLSIEQLNCGYGSVVAIHDVSFAMSAGSIFALLGPNGAGKTSIIMAIMGHVDVFGGRILLDGADITRRRAVDRVDLGIALVPVGLRLMTPSSVNGCSTISHGYTSGGPSSPARCPEANSKCWRSAGP
jgi:branched-chain amino acid transport system ATP-binding protein